MSAAIKRGAIARKIILYLFLFYVIYTPAIPGVVLLDRNITIPIITIFMLLINAAIKRKKETLVPKSSYVFCVLLTISNIYSLFIYLICNNSFNLMDSRIVQSNLAICYLVIITTILRYIKDNKLAKTPMDILYNLAAIQGVIGIFMLMSEGLHNIAIQLYGGDNIFITTTRIFGISSDYTYATPIYHGLIAAFLLHDTIIKRHELGRKVTSFIKLALILLIVMLNGRTGLVVFAASGAIFVLKYLIESKKIFKFIKYLAIVSVIFYGLIISLKEISPNTYNFLDNFTKDTYKLVTSNEADGNYALLRDSITFPSGGKIVFGEGIRVYGNKADELGYTRSDVGYVNDLYMGGIIYVILLYASYGYLILKKVSGIDRRLALMVALMLANYKGEAFRAGILVFGIIFICLACEETEKEHVKISS